MSTDPLSEDSLQYGVDLRSLRNLVVVALLVVGVMALHRTTNTSALIITGLFSNFPSAFAALVLGIPIGLLISRLTEQYRTLAARSEERALTESRRRTTLMLLQGELYDASQYIETRIAQVRANGAVDREITMPALSIELWASISRSGELKIIEDLNLLAIIARGYRSISDLREREMIYYTFLRTVGVTVRKGDSKAPWDHQVDLSALDPVAYQATIDAVNAIDSSLATFGSPAG